MESSPQATIECAVCQGRFAVLPEMVGTEVQCPHCLNVVMVPQVEFPEPEAAQDQAATDDSSKTNSSDETSFMEPPAKKPSTEPAQEDYFPPGFAKPSRSEEPDEGPASSGSSEATRENQAETESTKSAGAADPPAEPAPVEEADRETKSSKSTESKRSVEPATVNPDMLPPGFTASATSEPTSEAEPNDASSAAPASQPESVSDDEAPIPVDVEPAPVATEPEETATATDAAGDAEVELPPEAASVEDSAAKQDQAEAAAAADELLPTPAPTPQTEQADSVEADARVRRHRSPKKVDELLPPGASESPIVDTEEKPSETPAIVIPTEDGQQVAIREPTKTVGVGSKQRELVSLSDDERIRRRRTRSVTMWIVSALVLGLTFYILMQLDMGQVWSK